MNTHPSGGAGRMDRKREETKKKVITAAMGLFRGKGFLETTMEEIAEVADIAKGTLYNYFPVKEAILDEYIRRTFQERNAERLERLRQLPNTRARLKSAFSELMTGVQAQNVIFVKYIAYRMKNWVSFDQSEEEKSGFHLLSSEIIHLGQQSGEIRADVPVQALEDLCEFAYMLVVKRFYLAPQEFDLETALDQSIDLLMNGIHA